MADSSTIETGCRKVRYYNEEKLWWEGKNYDGVVLHKATLPYERAWCSGNKLPDWDSSKPPPLFPDQLRQPSVLNRLTSLTFVVG